MAEKRIVTIPNMPEETRKAVEKLMESKKDFPFNSVEECIASIMSLRMQFKAIGQEEEARKLEEQYHLEGVKVVYTVVNEDDESK